MKASSSLYALSFCVFSGLASTFAQDLSLPKPDKSPGMSLTEALEKRQSGREFSDQELTPQQLANLLWAANGITRPDGRRTAPTARNAQEIELYVIIKSGVYVYDADADKLTQVLKEDIRNLAGTQPFTHKAPVNILYVADYDKQTWDIPLEKKRQYGAVDSGFIGQNIYLYCAANGLSTVFRGMIDAKALHQKLNLPENKEVLYGQSVGFPKKDNPPAAQEDTQKQDTKD